MIIVIVIQTRLQVTSGPPIWTFLVSWYWYVFVHLFILILIINFKFQTQNYRTISLLASRSFKNRFCKCPFLSKKRPTVIRLRSLICRCLRPYSEKTTEKQNRFPFLTTYPKFSLYLHGKRRKNIFFGAKKHFFRVLPPVWGIFFPNSNSNVELSFKLWGFTGKLISEKEDYCWQ
jgi:hypothetical protein